MLNYHGSLTFTNDTTALVTFNFSGAIQIQVFGAFPVAGTFSMHSAYSIDGTGETQYEPPGVIGHPAYHQQFFNSNTLSTGTHKLVISNLGQAYYLDYIQLILPAAPSSTPTHGPVASEPPQSAAPASPGTIPTTQPAASSTVVFITQGLTITTTQTTQDATSPTSVHSTSVGSIPASSPPVSPITSTDARGSTSPPASTTQEGPTPVTPTGTSFRSEAVALPPADYVAIAVGGFVAVVAIVFGVWFLCRRRRRRSMANAVNPFDPGFTSFASSEKTQLSHGLHAHVNRTSSTASTSYRPYITVYEDRSVDSSMHAPSEEDVSEQRAGRTQKAEYEAIGSPPAVSTPVPGHFNGRQGDREALSPIASSPISPASNSKRARLGTDELWKRSVDGGVRLAGGPSGTRRDADLADVDERSAVSTLPPIYDSYPAI
ncbi:hypothetical protein K466DRAFT_589239 [Polyporus arcularius HHB13444]|uniref:Uncharacterized protein n=1 Tax=Polyporus arcularius HHB13444 TaxID=1314778 RepID=A0A5C3P4A7_9APHY|nr:hypothetical protein K466DRAFT_589239 [Polyporus arcularius HHB13444]